MVEPKNGEGEMPLDGDTRPSIIPARKPKKVGMPKLQLPARPSSSSSANPTSTGSRPKPTSLNIATTHASSSSSSSQPSLHLAIPANKTFSSLNSDADEGFEGSAGTTFTGIGGQGGIVGAAATTSHASIYPDTVPFASGAQDPYAMTNDLRRAIGKMTLDENTAGDEIAHQGGVAPVSSASARSGSQSSLQIPGVVGASAGAARPDGRHFSVESDPIRTSSDTCSVGSQKGKSPGQDLEEESELNLRGNLEALDRLGEGASGEVRKARYKPTGMVMAMKTISTSPNPAIHRQILRELSFNRTCHSDHIVRYYGAFLADEDTSIVICMEHCEAGSLDSIYKRVRLRNGRMGEKILAKIAESGLKGLAYLHERKIIHRDIKPSNILVTRDGQIKLCDFGVSGELINSIAGTFTGTSYYMAPERIKGMPYTITSDVWSLGLTVLELASNRFPFPPEGEPPLGPIDLLSYVISMNVPELKDDPEAGIKWTKAFRDFLEHCFEKDGNRRYAPVKMLNHPWMKKAMARVPQPDVGKFVADVWGWQSPISPVAQNAGAPTTAQNGKTIAAPVLVAENIDVPGVGRVASLRKAPSPIASMTSSKVATSTNGGEQGGSVRTPRETDSAHPRRHAGLSILVEKGATDPEGVDAEGRTPQERAIARKREADVGLVGSPTQEEG